MCWPLVSHIEMPDHEHHFEFGCTLLENLGSLHHLRDYIRAHGTRCLEENARECRELRMAFHPVVHHDEEHLYRTCAQHMRKHWGVVNCDLRLQKICLYDVGDYVDFHRDAVSESAHVATLELSLESADLQGGHLIFRDFFSEPDRESKQRRRHEEMEITEDEDTVVIQDGYHPRDMLKLAMYYTDCEHRIETITRGYRIGLEYEIVQLEDTNRRPKEEEKTTHHHPLHDDQPEMNDGIAEKIVDFLSKQAKTTRVTQALLMSHLYPMSGVTSRQALRGYDRLMYDALVTHHFENIELMPVCLFEGEDGVETRCMSLSNTIEAERDKKRGNKRQITLFLTPTVAQCMERLGQCNVDDSGEPMVPPLAYTTMAMILNTK